MEGLLADMYIYIYENMYALTGIYDKLTTYSNAIMGTLADGGVLHDAYLVVRTVAFGLLAVYFVIAFGTRMTGRETSPSIVFKTLLEYFIGFAFALNSFAMVKWFFEAGDGLAAYMLADSAGTEGELSAFLTTFKESIDNIGFTGQVMYLFKGLLPYLLCMIANIFILYAIVTRVLRICVNATLSPIAVANFFDGSRHSDGVRFIKKTASMCLQCSVIMVIVAGTSSISAYMSTSDTFKDALGEQQTVETLKNDMIDSAKSNNSLVSTDIWSAANTLGSKARSSDNGYSMLNKKYGKATAALLDNYDKVTKSQENTYKKYEKLLNIKIFSRDDNGHYIYNSDGKAMLNQKYVTFDSDKMTAFMNGLLGGNNIVILCGLMAIKVGLIKKSNSLCNTIVGL